MKVRDVARLNLHALRRGVGSMYRENPQFCIGCTVSISILCAYTDVAVILTFFILGVMSSIGFGVGIPTRILFLWPYILRHRTGNFIGDMASFLPVVMTHDAGSAFGELPPFLSSQMIISKLNLANTESLSGRTHMWFVKKMKKNGFYWLIALSCWPNMTFDAAGLAAGAVGMPFREFISATLIGKAVIRGPISCAFVLYSAAFSPEWLNSPASDYSMGWYVIVLVLTCYFMWKICVETAKEELLRMEKSRRTTGTTSALIYSHRHHQ